MSVKFMFPHLKRNDTAYVTVHLSGEQLASLRQWMKTPDYHQFIGFPNGVRLYRRGFGWYRLDVTREERAIDKLRVAVSLIRKWRAEYDEAARQDLRLKVLRHEKPGAKAIAYTDGQYQVMDEQRTVKPLTQHVKASPHKLEQLVAKLGSRG